MREVRTADRGRVRVYAVSNGLIAMASLPGLQFLALEDVDDVIMALQAAKVQAAIAEEAPL